MKNGKNTKYFLNIINGNKNKTSIRKLNTQAGTVTSQGTIIKATKLFYEKLYTNVDGDTNDSWIDEIKDSTEIPQISENDKLNMRKPISKDELFAIMKTFSKKQITRKRWIDSGIL